MSEKLKPCPHCGAPAKAEFVMGETWIDCSKNCTGLVDETVEEKAIEAWNRREHESRINVSYTREVE